MFSLTTNYGVSNWAALSEPLKKYREVVEKAFGSRKEVLWWLEHTKNHSPGHWWVSAESSTVSVLFEYALITTDAVVEPQTGMDRWLGSGVGV